MPLPAKSLASSPILTAANDNFHCRLVSNNLLTVTDSVNTANTQTLSYDVINRLNSAVSGTGGYGTLGWTYDKSGNRLTQTGTAITYT